MRIRDYYATTKKEFARKPARSLLAVVALALSSLILVTLAAFVYASRQVVQSQLGPSQSLNVINVTAAKSSAFSGLYSNVQLANGQNIPLTDSTVKALAALPHVDFVSPMSAIYEFKNFQVAGTAKEFVAQAVGIALPNSTSLPLSAGRQFDPSSNAHDAVVGLAYARELGYGKKPAELIGRQVRITTQEGYRGAGASIPPATATPAQNNAFNNTSTALYATIVGVTSAGQNQNQLFIPEAWARQVRTIYYNQPGGQKTVDQISQDGYSTIVVGSQASRYVPGIASKISKMGLGEISNAQIIKRFSGYTNVLWIIIGSVAVITFIATSLGIVNMLMMLVNEQRYSIAIWRVLGATKRQIRLMYILYCSMLGLVGGLLGALGGYGVSLFAIGKINHVLASNALTVVHLASAGQVLVPAAVLLTTVFSVLAGLYPARAAAKADLAAALSAGQ